MQLYGSASVSRKEASGSLIFMTTVAGSGVSIDVMSANSSLRMETMPAGGLRMRSKVACTSFDVRGLPSWKTTLGRILKVYVRPSGDTAQLSARSGLSLG